MDDINQKTWELFRLYLMGKHFPTATTYVIAKRAAEAVDEYSRAIKDFNEENKE